MTVPNEARTYKQPRRINAVSMTLLVLALAGGYVTFAAWPVIALHADVKNALEDALPRLYRANLLPEPDSSTVDNELRSGLIDQLTTLGVPDPAAALTFTRDTQKVAITVKLAATIDLKLIGKKVPVTLNPSVETSAARVSY